MRDVMVGASAAPNATHVTKSAATVKNLFFRPVILTLIKVGSIVV